MPETVVCCECAQAVYFRVEQATCTVHVPCCAESADVQWTLFDTDIDCNASEGQPMHRFD